MNVSHTEETLDTRFLQGLIQPQHLTPDAIREMREAFQSHPAHIAKMRDFLQPHVAERISHALAQDVNYGYVRHLYAQFNRNVSADEFDAATSEEQLLRFGQMTGVKPEVKMSPGLMQLSSLRHTWHDPRFAAYLSALTGIELAAPSSFVLNSLAAGDFIHHHNDVVPDKHRRRIAFIVYLNPNWKPEFGGDLRITSFDGQESTWPVEYNSLALFDVLGHKTHEVTLVEPAAGAERRNSLNGWFSEPERT